MKTDAELLTTEELATVFRVKVTTIRQWFRSGRLPKPVEVGRRLYLAREDLDEFLDDKRRTSA